MAQGNLTDELMLDGIYEHVSLALPLLLACAFGTRDLLKVSSSCIGSLPMAKDHQL